VALLTADYDDLCRDLARTEALRDAAQKALSHANRQVMVLEAEGEVLDRVADLFRTLIDREVVDNAKTVESLLTEGLQAIFDDLDLSVRSQIDIQRGKVAVDLITVQKQADGTVTEGSCTDAYGGSVATVESVLLRIVVLNRRGLRPLLLLDESLAAVAEHYVPRVGQFLSMLSERMGLDVLAVSHNPSLVEAATSAYRISKKDGKASFRKIGRA
jgi:ABC-type dipeptide/oligopeptide/nickel transport system ATPase subunit